MNNERIIQISHDLFWGYNEKIDISIFNSIEELALYIENNLIIFLEYKNLLILSDKAKKLKLHSHTFNNINEILEKTKENEIIYLCDHDCFK